MGRNRDPHSILHLQRTISNQAVLRWVQNVHPKLKVNAPADRYEQEADRIAGEVLRQKAPAEEHIKSDIQEKSLPPVAVGEYEIHAELESRLNRNQGGGSPVPDRVRTLVEPRLQFDFSRARVHTDVEAARMNEELGARAFTHGRNIYFGAGEYNPQSIAGKRLMVHELTHVAQQSNTGSASGRNEVQSYNAPQAGNGTIQCSIRPHPEISGDFIITPDEGIGTESEFIRQVRRDLRTKVMRSRLRADRPASDLLRVDGFDERLRICWNTELLLRRPSSRQIIVRLEGWGGRVSRFILISPRVDLPAREESREPEEATLPPLHPPQPPSAGVESTPPITCEGDTALEVYQAFVHNADRYGLPVGFLRRVGRDYNVRFASEQGVRYNINVMTLRSEVLRGACGLEVGTPGEAGLIRDVYEESAHAYLDLVSDEPRFREFITAGERHYQGAPTRRGTTTTDPQRVFHEAAAGYVAHRAATWFRVFEQLSIYAATVSGDPEAAERLRQMNAFANLRDQYNNQMARLTFGYSEEGGILGFGSEQVYTRRAMTPEMKAFLDHELLEDRIPDRFESVTGFQRLLRQAGVSL